MTEVAPSANLAGIVPLVRTLSEESATFERLLLSVRTVELLVAAGEAQFLTAAADETAALYAQLAALEVAREIATMAAADHLGLMGTDPTLQEIIAALGDGEGAALATLGDQLRAQAAEYEAVTDGGIAMMVQERIAGLDATIERIQGGELFADSYGSRVAERVPALTVDTTA